LFDFRTDLIESIDEDLLSMRSLQLNSIGDTETVYFENSLCDDSALDKSMPEVVGYFNQRIDAALDSKAGPAKLSSNFLRTNIILATNSLLDLQDRDADMILEVQPVGDNF
jgi:hypothetical protein